MKFGLEIADAWLSGIASVWKRVLVFWIFVVAASMAGQGIICHRVALESILSLGGVTYIFVGPLFYMSLLIAPVVWFRFIHGEKGCVSGFVLLGVVMALNAGYDRKISVSEASLRRLHIGALVMAWFLLCQWVYSNRRSKGK